MQEPSPHIRLVSWKPQRVYKGDLNLHRHITESSESLKLSTSYQAIPEINMRTLTHLPSFFSVMLFT